MAASRRRPGYNNIGANTTGHRGHPETVYPPEGYCLIETDLHRATTPLQVATFPFLSKLKLRSAINLSAEPLHEKVVEFFRSTGVTMLSPRSLDALDGPYDLWEEAAKESLELLLDADNQPMILLDSPTECESACLIGCLRRLQHWSVCAIHDEYHMLTMRNTSYDTNQRFIERFDLELVTLKANLPMWYREHLDMLEEERTAEADILQRDPDRPARAWTRGFSIAKEASTPARDGDIATGQSGGSSNGFDGEAPREETEGGAVENESPLSKPSDSAGEEEERGTKGARGGAVPDYRLNGFVYVCPLVSAGRTFTAKAWLQDEDD